MIRMTRKGKIWGGLGLSLAVLAACDGGAVIGDAASQFGQTFAAAFRADDNAAPVDATAITFAGATGPNLTAAPVDL
jgi:hypothetical protein